MKRLFVLTLICLFVIGVSAVSFADQPTHGHRVACWEGESPFTDSTDVHAIVEPYAAVTWGNIPFIEFEGSANEGVSSYVKLTIARNSTVSLSLKGTKLAEVSQSTHEIIPGGDSIDTSYGLSTTGAPTAWPNASNTDFSGGSLTGKGTSSIYVGVKGQLGDVDDQNAGSYKATITVTVSSSVARPYWD